MDQQNKDGKPKLDPEGQIAFLRGKGVTFERMGEAEAMRYLSRESYLFSAYAYRTLFPRRVGGAHDGEYANLDFCDLVDLERLDRNLRAALLPLALDAEHLAKARVLDEVGRRPAEDGHSIVRDYMAALSPSERSRREAEISRLRRDEYSGDLQRHYAAEMPIWVLLELSSFGTVADVYRFCASRWDDMAMLDEHYMLKKARDVRNACAHSAAIINGLGTNGHVARPAPSELTTALREAGFSKRSRSSRMRNPRLQQIATLLLLHKRMAGGTELADEGSARLRPLADDVKAVLSVTRPDASAEASMEFLVELVDRWF
jgi:abortive infection bacteriophage resistance protein